MEPHCHYYKETIQLILNITWCNVIGLVCCVQIRKLESTLMDIDNKTLWNDYRMAQPLNDRVVQSSFLPRLGKGSV